MAWFINFYFTKYVERMMNVGIEITSNEAIKKYIEALIEADLKKREGK